MRMPRIILELVPKGPSDFSTVAVELANGRLVDLSAYDVRIHHSPLDAFRAEFIQYLTEYGLSAYLRRGPLFEEVVPGGASADDVRYLLQSYVQQLHVEDELIIIDPYFFAPTNDPSYPDLVVGILRPILSSLKVLKVVTRADKSDPQLVVTIRSKLAVHNPKIQLIHTTTHSFHDRFWINPARKKGFLSGASLNGLGKKYALVDHLSERDTQDIIAAASAENLI